MPMSFRNLLSQPLLGLCLAALTATTLSVGLFGAGILLSGLAVLSVSLAGRRWARRRSRPGWAQAVFLGLAVAVFVIAWQRSIDARRTITLPRWLANRPVGLAGMVTGVHEGPTSLRLLVSGWLYPTDAPDVRWRGQFLLYVPPIEDSPAGRRDVCDVLTVTGTVVPISARRNPGGFDAHFYWMLRGVAGRIDPGSPDDLRVTTTRCRGVGLRSQHVARHVRKRFQQALTRGLGPGVEGVGRALVLGDRSRVPQDLVAAFSAMGIIHVLAVSGLHVGFVGATAGSLGRRIGLLGLLQALGSIVPVSAFVWLAGAPASAVRAGVMFGLLVLARPLYLPNSSFNFVAGAALALVLWRPLYAFDVGFQLSMGATLGIMLWQVPITALVERTGRWCLHLLKTGRGARGNGDDRYHVSAAAIVDMPGGWESLATQRSQVGHSEGRGQGSRLERLLSVVGVTVAAQLGTLPVIARQFHRISLVGVAANVVVIPVVGRLFTALLVALMLSAVAVVLAVPLLWLLRPLLAALVGMVQAFGRLPWTSLYVPAMQPWLVAIYYAVVMVLLAEDTTSRPALFTRKMTGLVGLIVFIVWITSPPWGAGRLSLVFLDVGQADAALIHTPCGRTVVVDTGSFDADADRDAGRDTVLPALYDLRWTHVDWLILSHWHDDHVGGAAALLRSGLVSRVAVAAVPVTTDGEQLWVSNLASEVGRLNLPVVAWQEGKQLYLGCGVSLHVLYPPGPDSTCTARCHPELRGTSPNSRSLVVRLDYGAFSALLVGDLDSEGERRMVQNACATCLRATLLKVGHHGSLTSTSTIFVNAVRPKAAIVSVGPNPYGLPAPTVVKRLQAAGTRVFRTDRCGALMVTTDGKHMEIKPQLPRGCT